MQESYSTLWEGFATDKEALRARNKRAKDLKAKGFNVKCFMLRNQIKPYSGFGEPDGRICSVYYVDWI